MKQSKRKKEFKSEFSYNRLWKMLIDRNMKKGELQEISDVSAASIAKMGRCENVTTDVLLRICEALDCNIEDIMERIPSNRIKRRMHKRRGFSCGKTDRHQQLPGHASAGCAASR